MTPEAALFFEKAEDLLAQAETMLQVQLSDACGRNAYLAAFHAAQAYIFRDERRVLKSHHGVRVKFARLTKDNARFEKHLRTFLVRAYNLKAVADYETGPDAHVGHTRPRERCRRRNRSLPSLRIYVAIVLHSNGIVSLAAAQRSLSSSRLWTHSIAQSWAKAHARGYGKAVPY